jgi:hypothetical protein
MNRIWQSLKTYRMPLLLCIGVGAGLGAIEAAFSLWASLVVSGIGLAWCLWWIGQDDNAR